MPAGAAARTGKAKVAAGAPATRGRPPAPLPAKPDVRIFVSYSHADAEVREKLERHLAVLGRDGVATWYDGDMLAGDHLDRGIGRALRQAHVFVALVSSDYLHSRYCQLEYRRAMGRRARGAMRVAAVVVRPCDWKAAPMAAFKLLPHDGRAVSDFRPADKALVGIVQALRLLVKAVRAEMAAPAAARPKARSPAKPAAATTRRGSKPSPPDSTAGKPVRPPPKAKPGAGKAAGPRRKG